MTDRAGTTSLAAVAVYLAATVFASYGVLADSTWDREPWVLPALMVLHTGAGFAIGRWWALALPVAWALLSAGAEGYDTPVSVHVAYLTPFTWIPATAVGVAARRVVERRRRGTGRLWPPAVVLVAGLAVVFAQGS